MGAFRGFTTSSGRCVVERRRPCCTRFAPPPRPLFRSKMGAFSGQTPTAICRRDWSNLIGWSIQSDWTLHAPLSLLHRSKIGYFCWARAARFRAPTSSCFGQANGHLQAGPSTPYFRSEMGNFRMVCAMFGRVSWFYYPEKSLSAQASLAILMRM